MVHQDGVDLLLGLHHGGNATGSNRVHNYSVFVGSLIQDVVVSFNLAVLSAIALAPALVAGSIGLSLVLFLVRVVRVSMGFNRIPVPFAVVVHLTLVRYRLSEVAMLRLVISTLAVEDVSWYRDTIHLSIFTMGARTTIVLFFYVLVLIKSWRPRMISIKIIHALVQLLGRSSLVVLNVVVLHYRVSDASVLSQWSPTLEVVVLWSLQLLLVREWRVEVLLRSLVVIRRLLLFIRVLHIELELVTNRGKLTVLELVGNALLESCVLGAIHR